MRPPGGVHVCPLCTHVALLLINVQDLVVWERSSHFREVPLASRKLLIHGSAHVRACALCGHCVDDLKKVTMDTV